MPVRIRNTIKRVLFKLQELYQAIRPLGKYGNIAYSQEGEDRILFSMFSLLNRKKGFYVDVGAYHPKRFSNTHLFYQRGWRGINIDANAASIALFQKMRPKDINIAIGVAEKQEKLTFYLFDEPAFNTFDAQVAQIVTSNSLSKIIEERVVEVMSLSQILDIYLPKGQRINFLSVDVEGRDLTALKSNDWSRFIPSYVLVEYHSGFDQKVGFSFQEVLDSQTAQFLKSRGYEAFAKTLNTIFFRFKKFPINTDLKIYSYDLPAEYWSKPDELSLPSETFYAISDFFKNNLGTKDPAEADFFFVPLNLIQYQFRNENPANIINELGYLSDKKNHIMVATGDFSQRSKNNHYGHAYQKTYDWLDKFILLALESTSDLIPGQDIGIIPFNTLVDDPYFNTNDRIYLYSFLGRINHELLPENHVRTKLKYLEPKPDVLITAELDTPTRRRLKQNYKSPVQDDFELLARNSIFTLAPSGYGKWTYRFFHAIQWGSIPVLFSDDYIKPFFDSIPYDLFSITLPEKEILNVDKILRGISSNEIRRYQENLKACQVHFTRRAFFENLVRSLESLRVG